MAKHIYLFLLPLLLLSPHLISATFTSICSKTPYPYLCNSLAAATTETTLNASLRETLAEVQNTHKLITEMDLSSFNNQAKTAWADCVYLYEDSIYHLTRSITSKTNQLDVQTWLSAAIANEQTCQNGFLDFNLPPSLMPFINNSSSSSLSSSSKLLSNSLAINKAISSSSEHNKINNRRLLAHDFPEWVSAGDRKLLQSSVKGDIVVAQDGSGDYKTISEGLAASVNRRSGTKRFVIYVKKGIYKENVEVKRSMKNIMLIGDGIDATIVTASKNVQDGSTTFRSATFGHKLDQLE